MLKLAKRLSGDYPITATATGSNGAPAAVTVAQAAVVYDAANVEVFTDAPELTDGKMALAIPHSELVAGRYRARWTGTVSGVEQVWDTYFEVIEFVPYVSAALIADVKLSLRISGGNTAYDDEVTDLITAAISDLVLSGVAPAAFIDDMPDPLVKRAIVVYCKANFGFDNPDADRLMKSFESLETHLALSAEYQA